MRYEFYNSGEVHDLRAQRAVDLVVDLVVIPGSLVVRVILGQEVRHQRKNHPGLLLLNGTPELLCGRDFHFLLDI